MNNGSPVSRRSLSLPSTSRYELLVKIASGGMATVYVGRLTAMSGFSRFVAIKRAHPHLVDDVATRQMLIEEATLASRIHHANVVAIQDVEHADDELLLVMDYVEGGSLAELRMAAASRSLRVPLRIGMRIALDACAGLHAVHELAGEDGRPQGLVHRDVSPHNILVGVDGTSRIADFGVAKLAEGSIATSTGILKGKPAYLAPEYIRGDPYTRRSDLFALAVVVWEALTGRWLFRGHNDADTLLRVVGNPAPPPSTLVPELGTEIDGILARALEKQPELRQSSVLDFATALEDAARRRDLLATHAEVGAVVRDLLSAKLDQRREQLRSFQPPSSPALPAAFGDVSAPAPRVLETAARDVRNAEDAPPASPLENTLRVSAGPQDVRIDVQPKTIRTPYEASPRPSVTDSTLAVSSRRDHDGASSPDRRRMRALVIGAAAVTLVGGVAVWAVLRRGDAAPRDAIDAPAGPAGQSATVRTALPGMPGGAPSDDATGVQPGGPGGPPIDGHAPQPGTPGGSPVDVHAPQGQPATDASAAAGASSSAPTGSANRPPKMRPPGVPVPVNPYKARLKQAE